MERTNKPSVEEIESIRLSTRNLATRTTSYLHPAKFRALQAAGVLHPATSDLPAYALRLYCDDYTVPRHRERRRDDKGRAYYLNHEAKTTQWEHPEAEAVLAKARGEGREGEPSWSLSAAVAGDGDAPVTGHRRLLRKWEEDYTAEGVLPPWILEETAAPPEGAGWSRARARIRKRKQQGLPVHCTPKVKM
ncbi:hypothetical protein RB597_006124 [Gaeumannomyces tritici]